jgi:hypothetical protein
MSILNVGSYSDDYGVRYYILWAILEFVIFCLFILPTYFMANIIHSGAENGPVHIAIACVVFFVLNM